MVDDDDIDEAAGPRHYDVVRSDFVRRFRRAIEHMGWENAARAAGKSVKQLRRYLAGTDPPLSVVAAIAAGSGASLDDLVMVSDSRSEMARALYHASGRATADRVADVLSQATGIVSAPTDPWDEYVRIPRYDITASAGAGSLVDREMIVDHLAFRADWVRQNLAAAPDDLALISAQGDSMEPTIRSGDLLLVNTSIDQFRDDAIYVLRIVDQLVVKRVQRFLAGAVVVRSDNPAYVEETLSAEDIDNVAVAGRVVWIARLV